MGGAQNIANIPKEGIKDVIQFPQDAPLPLYYLPHHYAQLWTKQREMLEYISQKKFKSIEEIPGVLEDLANIQTDFHQKLRGVKDLFKLLSKNEESKESEFDITKISVVEAFEELIPFVAGLAIQSEDLFPDGSVPIMPRGKTMKVKFSKLQCACLVSLMFLNVTKQREEHKEHVDIPHSMQEESNALDFMQVDFGSIHNIKDKFFCLLTYFREIKRGNFKDHECIEIERKSLTQKEYQGLSLKYWMESQEKLLKPKVLEGARIEDCKEEPKTEVDFANQFIGGLALGMSYTQEDILFVTAPDCIPSMLICERMTNNEALQFTGVTRYSDYTGYGSTFKFKPLHLVERKFPRQIVAIDALCYSLKEESNIHQWHQNVILRELNKAFIGFHGNERALVTGKWGCGAFSGDVQLKFLIQWIATSQCKRVMHFCGFGDPEIKEAPAVTSQWTGETVGDLVKAILSGKRGAGQLFKKLI